MKINGQIRGIGSDGTLELIIHGNMRKLKINQPVKLEIFEAKRTLSQNAFYWVFINWVLFYYKENSAPDWTDTSLHYHFGKKFLLLRVPLLDTYAEVIKSTSELSIPEFCEYMDSIMQTAVEEVYAPIHIFIKDYEDWKRAHGVMV